MRTALIALFLSLLGTVVADAQMMSIAFYRETISSKEPIEVQLTKMYIRGLGEGMSWADSRQERDSHKFMFCPPDKLDLTVEIYLNILNRQIEQRLKMQSKEDVDKLLVGVVLLTGLQDTFPCKGK